jgi:hypothetical protein
MESRPRCPVFSWYFVTQICVAFALAWALTDGTDPAERNFEVLCEGGVHSCSCKGFIGHQLCRHTSAIEQLRKDGVL